MNGPLHCDACKTRFPDALLSAGVPGACLGCGEPTFVEMFPAFFRRLAPGGAGEHIVVESEAGCFYHPQKRAVVPCAACGRFLCGLCDCELHGQHYCPACLESGEKKGKIKNLQNQRTRHDNIALTVAILPLLIFYFVIITAPIAIYLALRHWKSPRSLVQPGSARLIWAVVIAVLELLGCGAIIYAIATS